MISPWSFVEPALDGLLGRRVKLIAKFALISFLAIGSIWHDPLIWLIQQLANWKAHEVGDLLQKVYGQLHLMKPPTSVPGGH